MRIRTELLHRLLNTPSVSGCEQSVQQLVRRELEPLADNVESDLLGNLIIGFNPGAKQRVVLAAHADRIGFMVKHIDKDGFLTLTEVGGIDEAVVPGEHLIVHGREGPVAGVIGKVPVHKQTKKEEETVPALGKLWLDIGARNREEAEARVCIGDYATYSPRIVELSNRRLASPGLDNAAGLLVAIETARLCAEGDLPVALYLISTVQEEIGTRGAQTAVEFVEPTVGITIDVTHASDDPGTTAQTAIPCHLGGGPTVSSGPNTNPMVEQMIHEAAKRLKVRTQIEPNGKTEGNDSKAIQVACCGVATASIGIPQRSMHTQAEVCSLDDMEAATRILVEFIRSINDETDFRPATFYDREGVRAIER